MAVMRHLSGVAAALFGLALCFACPLFGRFLRVSPLPVCVGGGEGAGAVTVPVGVDPSGITASFLLTRVRI